MFKLLNRFAWILSLCFWFILTFSFVWIDSYRIWDETIIISAFFWVIVWLIIKRILFSKKFIKSRLEFFVEQSFNLKEDKLINKT